MRALVLAVMLFLGLAATDSLAATEPPAQAPAPPAPGEITQAKPSGFWGSTRPAVGGAYRWRMLGIGVGLLSVTGFVMWRLMRRASEERAAGTARHR